MADERYPMPTVPQRNKMKIPLSLGRDHAARKALPIMRVLGYFTAAIAGLTRHAVRGNAQHNPGEPLHWARGKSMDHAECVGRHSFDMMDLHAWLERNPTHPERDAVLAELEQEYDARLWRAAADSQEFYEKYRGAPVSPSSRMPTPEAPLVPPGTDAAGDSVIAQITGVSVDRSTFPPVAPNGFRSEPNTVWRVERDWYFNPPDDLRHSQAQDKEYPTEAAARAAYWADKDAG
jgi:hypothetical protein